MICRVHGILERIESGKAELDMGDGLHYEVLLSAWAQQQLSGLDGQPVTLYTLHFLEGSAQGSTFVPRLAGFLSETDKRFFELFTTVKGIGPKKALGCLVYSSDQLAGAIAERDVKLIQTLPGVGKRMAETIIATLHGKVDEFVGEAAVAAGDGSVARAAVPGGPPREALDVLMQLGESRANATAWIDQAMVQNPELDDAQQIIAAALRIKSGVK